MLWSGWVDNQMGLKTGWVLGWAKKVVVNGLSLPGGW